MTWKTLCPLDELPQNATSARMVDGEEICAVRRGDDVYAIIDLCPHMYTKLSTGQVVGTKVKCALHGARFDLRDGRNIEGDYPNIKAYATRVVDGVVEIDL